VKDHKVIQQVQRLHIRTKHQVADVLSGAYLSVFKGSGIEFEEVRPYVPGDEIRSIDWNVTARTGIPHIKRFVEERELTVMLLVDISGSQEFGSEKQSKRETASELAALLAFSAIANKDKIGLLLFHTDSELFIPPRKGQKHAMRVVREVLAHTVDEEPPSKDLPWIKRWFRFLSKSKKSKGKRTDISAALEFCRRVLPRKSVLFVISDFIDAGYLSTMRNVNRKHDVIAAMVNDPKEEEIPKMGLIELQDAENGQRTIIDTSSSELQQHLQQLSQLRKETLKKELRASKIDLIHLNTASSVIDPLLEFLHMRQRRNLR
jgi:uncharacterized protein (DUF58 family)